MATSTSRYMSLMSFINWRIGRLEYYRENASENGDQVLEASYEAKIVENEQVASLLYSGAMSEGDVIDWIGWDPSGDDPDTVEVC